MYIPSFVHVKHTFWQREIGKRIELRALHYFNGPSYDGFILFNSIFCHMAITSIVFQAL